MDVAEKLKLLGLSDGKVKETLKNERISVLLADIVDKVSQQRGE